MKILIFFGGAIMGAVATYWILGAKVIDPLTYNTASSSASVCARALSQLRDDNKDDAIEILELKMDGDLITFINLDSAQMSSPHFKIISRIAEYRKKYPRTNQNPEVDSAIKKVLSMVPPTTSP